MGCPGEGEEVYRKYLGDIPLEASAPADRRVPGAVRPLQPRLHRVRAGDGLDLRPCDFYAMVYPFSDDVLANLAYHFVDQDYRAEYLVTMVRWLARIREQVEAWRRQWAGGIAASPPELCFETKGGAAVVYDSRSGHPWSTLSVTQGDASWKGSAAREGSRILPRNRTTRRRGRLSTRFAFFRNAACFFRRKTDI